MNEEERSQTVKRYEHRLDEFGYNVKTLGWNSKESQTTRFEILSQIGEMNNKTVLDIGCGFGDFYGFLDQKGLNVEYTGLDISERLVSIAREKYPKARFEVRDILVEGIEGDFDYVVASGVFNWKLSDNIGYLKKMLEKAYAICNSGVAFDMMSSYVDFFNSSLFYYKPEEVFSFSKQLSRRVVLRHDYMPFEFTIYLYKNNDFTRENVFEEVLNKINTCDNFSPR